MNAEDLKKLGLTDEEVIQKIIVAHGKDIEKFKAAGETAKTENDNLKKQLDEASKAIEAFKAMDVDSVKKAADEWKTKAETAQAEATKQIEALKFDHALGDALTGAKAKNGKAVRALLDTSLLKLADDGSISGLKEQLEKIKTDADYLFDSETVTPKIVTSSNNKQVINDSVVIAARKAAGLPVE